jgi:hypothetical protein
MNQLAELLDAYPKCHRRFRKVGWLSFLQKFQGYDKHITKEFVELFDGTQAQIGDLKLQVSKYFIAQATGLPQSGEK